MADTLQVAFPGDIRSNPENPRLIFREAELSELRASIEENGILVPLTVFQDDDGSLVLLDGERRWRCAKRLGLARVPVIVQPKPSPMQNIMMMFAIHNARTDWDPLPTAMKLEKLAQMHEVAEGRPPTEKQLAQLASLTRGEVRRLKNILALPQRYLDQVLLEQDKPRSEQRLTVDHVLEVTRAARLLEERHVITPPAARALEDALVDKFERRVLRSTVDPRLLIRASRAVERGDVPAEIVAAEIGRLIGDPVYTIQDAYSGSVARAEMNRSAALSARRLVTEIRDLAPVAHSMPLETREAFEELHAVLSQLLRR